MKPPEDVCPHCEGEPGSDVVVEPQDVAYDYAYVAAPTLAVLVERIRDYGDNWRLQGVYQPGPPTTVPMDETWEAVMERQRYVTDAEVRQYLKDNLPGAAADLLSCDECDVPIGGGHAPDCKRLGTP